MTITPIKTSDYTANAYEFVPCDLSGGSFAITLPSAPAEGSVIETKIIKIGTSANLEIKTS